MYGGVPFVASYYLVVNKILYFAVNAPVCGYGSLNVNGLRKTVAKIEKVKALNPYVERL